LVLLPLMLLSWSSPLLLLLLLQKLQPPPVQPLLVVVAGMVTHALTVMLLALQALTALA
jgi:hypothetical protein